MKAINKVIKMMLLGLVLFSFGCASNKIMVGSTFRGESKIGQMLLEKKDEKEKLYNAYVRLCDLGDKFRPTGCKESMILENVVPANITE